MHCEFSMHGRESILLTSALVKHEEVRGCKQRRSTCESQRLQSDGQHLKHRGAEPAASTGTVKTLISAHKALNSCASSLLNKQKDTITDGLLWVIVYADKNSLCSYCPGQ